MRDYQSNITQTQIKVEEQHFYYCYAFHCQSRIFNKMNCELMLTHDTTALRQTGSRNLTG